MQSGRTVHIGVVALAAFTANAALAEQPAASPAAPGTTQPAPQAGAPQPRQQTPEARELGQESIENLEPQPRQETIEDLEPQPRQETLQDLEPQPRQETIEDLEPQPHAAEWEASAEPEPEPKPPLRRGADASFGIGSPLWLDTDAVNPGFSIVGQLDYAFGWIAPEFGLGYQINKVTSGEAAGQGIQGIPITIGARLQVPKPVRVRPFLAAALNITVWSLTADIRIQCIQYAFYCYDKLNWSVVPGFSGRAGIGFGVAKTVDLDIGARVALTAAGAMFDKPYTWAEPYIGATALF